MVSVRLAGQAPTSGHPDSRLDCGIPGRSHDRSGDLDNSQLHFDGMEVKGLDNEKLGKVDGFIIDKSSVRPYYVVVNAGGWFKSKYFLLPIGHVGMAPTDYRRAAKVLRP